MYPISRLPSSRATTPADKTAVKSNTSKTKTPAKPTDQYAVTSPKTLPQPPAAKAPEHHWYDGLTSAFSKTQKAIGKTVNTAVSTVKSAISTVGKAVSDAGKAVQTEGRELMKSGAALLKLGQHAIADVKHLASDASRVLTDAGQVVVDAGKATVHASTALLTGNPKELDLAHRNLQHAHSKVVDAHAAIVDAHQQAVDLGADASKVKAVLVDAKHDLEKTRSSVLTAMHTVQTAISTAASVPQQVINGVHKALVEGGHDARVAIEKDIPGGKALLHGTDVFMKGQADLRSAILHGNPLAAAQALSEEAHGIAEFSKGAWKTAQPLVEFGKKKLMEQVDGFSVGKQVKKLEPGDTYKMELGGDVHIELGVEAMGTLTVKRLANGTYEVSAKGTAGVNGDLDAGGHVGSLKVGAAGAAHALLGGTGVFTCATAEEATRAAHILEQLAGATAVNPSLGAVVLTPDNVKFLAQHTSGLEVSGTGSVSGDAGIGITKGPLKAGIGMTGSASGTETLRLDMKNGVPTGLTIRQELRGELSLEAAGGLTIGMRKAKPGESNPTSYSVTGPSGLKLSGEAQGVLTVETHIDFPPGETGKDPAALAKKYAQLIAKSASTKVNVLIEGQGSGEVSVLNKSSNLSANVTFEGKPGEVLSPAALKLAFQGDFDAAARAMGKHVKVDGTVRAYDSDTWGIGTQSLDILGVGIGATLSAERKHFDAPMYEFHGTGDGLYDKVTKKIGGSKRNQVRG